MLTYERFLSILLWFFWIFSALWLALTPSFLFLSLAFPILQPFFPFLLFLSSFFLSLPRVFLSFTLPLFFPSFFRLFSPSLFLPCSLSRTLSRSVSLNFSSPSSLPPCLPCACLVPTRQLPEAQETHRRAYVNFARSLLTIQEEHKIVSFPQMKQLAELCGFMAEEETVYALRVMEQVVFFLRFSPCGRSC